jgi:DnaJ-domain-containing protein 1
VQPVLNDLDVSISERQFGRVQGGPIDLSLAELRRARLDQATLTEANLAGAALVDADLSDARLENADLSGANLSGANLAYAALTDARLHGANLRGADLRLAKGLTQAQIDQTLGDRRTTLPHGLSAPRAWLLGEPASGQIVTRTGRAGVGADDPDPYLILGVRPGASIHEIRAAWLRLVKDLHPDGASSDEPRLKIINQAYQRLKDMDRQATQRQAAPSSTRRKARAVFATFFLVSAVVSIVVVAAWLYFTQPNATPGDAIPPPAPSSQGKVETQLQPSVPPPVPGPSSGVQPPAPGPSSDVPPRVPGPSSSVPPPMPGPSSTDEPAAGADKRLR